jgi:hypothetical protein
VRDARAPQDHTADLGAQITGAGEEGRNSAFEASKPRECEQGRGSTEEEGRYDNCPA